MFVDYEYKAKLLDEGLPNLCKKVVSSQYIHYAHLDASDFTMPFDTANITDDIMKAFRPDDWNECKKINHADFERSRRLYHRVEDILKENGGLFLTFTFTDDVLSMTKALSRKAYVCRFLKLLNAPYVANIDYGGKNGREHYHAVVGVTAVNYKLWHKYGAIDGERIVIDDVINKKLGRYISKLTNHAIKDTAKACRVIYSRY